jgi:iron(III) transport system ATP-binding protein
MTSVLALEGVTLRYGDATVLDALSLDLQSGETLALLGPSGSGKTTIVRMLLGFEVPQTGTVRVAGEIASRDARLQVLPEDRKLAVVFQDLALWPHLTVAQHLSFGLDSQGLPAAACVSRIHAMLQRVGLAERAQSYPLQLSGGERQRVAIARALVLEPRAVLLDEPLANLDVVLRDELLRLFGDLLSARHTPALYVTHDLREAAALADRIAVLEHGRIVQCGSLEILRTRPATEFIRRLVEDLERPVVGATSRGQPPSAVR